MKYLIQRELLELLDTLGLRISEDKFIDKKNAGKIPKADVQQVRPYPVKYYIGTVKKIVKYFSETRGIEVVDLQGEIDKIIKERKYAY